MAVMNVGIIEQISPLVRCLLAPNPSPFTYNGTQTYIIGVGEIAVIDPGPDISSHVDALVDALDGEQIMAITCTHTHRDHSPASRPLQAVTGAPIVGCAPLVLEDDGPRADHAFDAEYMPDRVLADGDILNGPGWTLKAVAAPGHTSNHLCLALEEEKALFTGDHVMGWSTTVVSPPDGDMAAYMQSLGQLLLRDDHIYYPAHGPAIEEPRIWVQELIHHRRNRETQILDQLARGVGSIPDIVAHIYTHVDPRLHPAAGGSVLAHLIDLEARRLVHKDKEQWSMVA